MIDGNVGGALRPPDIDHYFPVTANVSDATFTANIRAACQRDLPWLQAEAAHAGHAVIVGGGPSLPGTLAELEFRAGQGQLVIALNGAASWLIERGIVPDVHVLLDARPSTARFVVPGKGIHYHVASQCDPSVFDALRGERVTLWHPHVEGVTAIIGDRETALIGGGTTVGLQAIAVAYAKGFRKFHLFGFDSCYSGAPGGEGHAYPQPENDGEDILQATVRGRVFRAAPWMLRQAAEFEEVARQLVADDCLVTVAGDGLIAHIVREMNTPGDAACYDLSHAPASWDFLIWLVNAEMAKRRRGISSPLRVAFKPGPKDGFRDDALPTDAATRRGLLDNVLRPVLPMLGAVEDGAAVEGHRHGYMFREIVQACTAGEVVPRFVPSADATGTIETWLAGHDLKPGEFITITLREAEYWPQRNSDIEAWTDFAATCGVPVVWVRDTAKAAEPMPHGPVCPEASRDVQVRSALYHQARCNLLVANGPMALLVFGAAPFLMFGPLVGGYSCGTPEWWEKAIGVPAGSQFPWCAENQRIVWHPDMLHCIREAFAQFIDNERTKA